MTHIRRRAIIIHRHSVASRVLEHISLVRHNAYIPHTNRERGGGGGGQHFLFFRLHMNIEHAL